MRCFVSLLLMTVLSGCGSNFIEAPGPAPNFEECFEIERELVGTTPNTFTALPFAGRRATVLYTELPEYWDDFHGTVHLFDISWNIDWFNSLHIYVGDFSVANWNGSSWEVYSRIDIKPSLEVYDDKWLKFESQFSGTGFKPKGKETIRINVTAGVCGIGAHLIAEE